MLFIKSSLVILSSSLALAIESSSTWTTLTAGPAPTDALTNFTSSFGIAPIPITDSAILSSLSEAATQTVSTTTLSSSTSTKSSSSASSTVTVDVSDYFKVFAEKSTGTLELTLVDNILYDAVGRIGSIVANRQFQFDGPPPQAGAIYAVGWSITEDGYLAIGDNDVFYQCLSGTFYNLYDQSIGAQCNAIYLQAVGFFE